MPPYRTLYTGFGLEGISTPQARNALIGRAMSYLLQETCEAGDLTGAGLSSLAAAHAGAACLELADRVSLRPTQARDHRSIQDGISLYAAAPGPPACRRARNSSPAASANRRRRRCRCPRKCSAN
jgi:hypothetical protein